MGFLQNHIYLTIILVALAATTILVTTEIFDESAEDDMDDIFSHILSKRFRSLSFDKHSKENGKFLIKKEMDAHGQTGVYISGKGVKEYVSFLPREDVTVYMDGDTLVVGDRVFTDSPGTLYIFDLDRTCVKSTYKREEAIHRKRKSAKECYHIRQQMKAATYEISPSDI